MDEKLSINFVWQNVSKNLEDEVVDFWLEQGAIKDEESARKRAGDLVAICRSGDHLVGVSTHAKYFYPPLQNHFHLSRTFIKDGHRNQGIMGEIFNLVWKTFEDQKLYEKEEIVGILSVMENQYLNKKTKAVWPDLANAVLAGFDRRGFQIRVGYFPEANIVLPKQPT
ncbi:MAG: hypothetical protein RIM99_17980 [Cyclobacteriaceae bacterium]